MTRPANLLELADLRRARDLIDRAYAEPLDVASVARVAHCSASHFARRYRTVFGETPYQHLVVEQPYGVINCAFRDPFGNMIRFCQELSR